MRVRGTLFWNTDNASLDGVAGVAGMAVMEQNSISTEEGPLTSPHRDWMAYQSTILDSITPGNYLVDRQTIDVKASRKMEELGQTLVLSLEHDAAATAVTVKHVLSVGLKLP